MSIVGTVAIVVYLLFQKCAGFADRTKDLALRVNAPTLRPLEKGSPFGLSMELRLRLSLL